MTMQSSLISTAGLEARIFHLPDREPFMLAADLATAYETETENVTLAVRRNPDRFPEDFAFRLTVEETARFRQNVGTSAGQRTDMSPLVFTHAGALALSGVLRSSAAARVSVAIHRAFAALERQAFEQMQFMLDKLRTEKARFNRIRWLSIEGVRLGYNFEEIWRLGDRSYSRPRIAQALRECVALGLIERLPEGMPQAQADLFGDAV